MDSFLHLKKTVTECSIRSARSSSGTFVEDDLLIFMLSLSVAGDNDDARQRINTRLSGISLQSVLEIKLIKARNS